MSATPTQSVSRLPSWLAATALVALTFLAYGGALRGGLLWDDAAHVTTPALRSWHGLGLIWSEPGVTQQYYPVLHTSFWLEHRLWGDSVAGYHLTNLLLHASTALLFCAVLRRLRVPGAWPAAFLFAVHPVHVESVAWISEQKNTLSALFYLAAAYVYLDYDERRKPATYLLATALFVAGLLAKSVVATLPAALLVIAWWRRGRIDWRRDALPLAPWLLFGVAAGLFTAWVERTLVGAGGAAFALTLGQRLVLCGRALWFYAANVVWPQGLTFIYPHWSLEPARVAAWLPLLAAGAVAGVAWALRRRTRTPLTVVLLFAGTLFPVLGFVDVYPFQYAYVADHFQYLANCCGLAALAALSVRAGPDRRALGAGVIAVVALGVLTTVRARAFVSSETLWRDTLARNPSCWMACNNLGKDLMADPARRAEAVPFLERALALRPDYAEAENNLGLTLTQVGRAADALPHLVRARRLDPRSFQAANNHGIALARLGRVEEAVQVFGQAAALNPTMPNIQENWGKALLLLGRKDEAARHFERAAQLHTAASSAAP